MTPRDRAAAVVALLGVAPEGLAEDIEAAVRDERGRCEGIVLGLARRYCDIAGALCEEGRAAEAERAAETVLHLRHAATLIRGE